jgi:hypothetical protein
MKYQKKPVVIEAWQFTRYNFSKGVPRWIEYVGQERNQSIKLWSQYGGKIIGGEIKTLEGNMKVSDGDYIIKGVHGELYPCKPDIFKETYEPVETKRNKSKLRSLINSLV